MTTNRCSCLLTLLILHFYHCLIFAVRWIRGPIRKITVRAKEFAKQIRASEWEWKSEEKSMDGKDHYHFEFSRPDGESLFVDVISTDSHVEGRVFIGHLGRTYDSGRLLCRQSEDRRVIHCGGLLLEMREPFRRWRICFRGEMTDESGDCVSVAVGGWFKPTSDARLFYSNLPSGAFDRYFLARPARIICNILAYERQRRREEFVQWGEIHCELSVDGSTESIRYRGMRERRKVSDSQREDHFAVYFPDGHRFTWRSEDSQEHIGHLVHGLHTHVDQKVRAITVCNDDLIYNPAEMGILVTQNANGHHEPFTKISLIDFYRFERTDGTLVTINRIRVDHKGSEGIAFFVNTTVPLTRHTANPVFEEIPAHMCSASERLRPLLPLSHRACQDGQMAGGKGANLARLTAVQNQFTVPRGFVITTSAYSEHLHRNPQLEQLIAKFKNGTSKEHLEDLSTAVGAAFEGSQLPPSLREEIANFTEVECGNGLLAVRSSAVGEDGAELSAAGQLESVLNVKPDMIESALKQCWASNFRREVVSYRRSHGQPLSPPMAVVVQSMVTSGTAGVMFTCDPVRRDPSRFVINAVVGMGEDIVSGAVTPDTVVVSRRGRVIDKPERCCVDEVLVSRLLNVGIFLENLFGQPQDVEFVVRDGRVHLVQTRNVTGLDRESEFELRTEFDSGTLTEQEIFTTANVGEVMPRPQVPLSYSSNFPLYEKALGRMFQSFNGGHVSAHYDMTLNTTNHKIFFNIGELYLPQWQVLEHDPLSEYTLAGEKILTQEMYDLGRKRHAPKPAFFPLYRLGFMVHTMLWGAKKALNRAETHSEAMEALEGEGDALRQLERAEKQREVLTQLIYDHSYESSCSSFTYVIVAMIIRGSVEGDLTADMLSDIATLFGNSTSSVISADVPTSLKKIARAIARSGIRADFEALEGDVALELLKGNRATGPLVDEFLTKHGHRGPFELDIYATEWSRSAELLVDTLKTMLNDPSEEAVEVASGNEDVIDQLKNKPKWFARPLMHYMVKQTHIGVSNREYAKNLLVRGTVALRRTMRRIGEEMHSAGLLPDSDLIFFLTLPEIYEVLSSRSPKLVSRAMRRRNFHPKLAEYRYKHVYWGCVEPMDFSGSENLRTLVELRGTAVCEGKVTGLARVAATLDEARLTQPGEILITRFTDICWSPFFPIVRGIVTEIGGLLSHGAVVAREYGLPSLIAVAHATDVFQTGDLVELDAFKGIISKVEKGGEIE